MSNQEFSIRDKITNGHRTATVIDDFKGTEKEGIWLMLMFDKAKNESKDWMASELIENIKKSYYHLTIRIKI